MYYEKTIKDIATLKIDDNFIVVGYDLDEISLDSLVKLESKEEADKLIAEFEDVNGELCWEESSVTSKYKELHKFRP